MGEKPVHIESRHSLLPTAKDAPALVAVTLAYLIAALVGLQWSIVPGAGTAVWPASGIAFAALVLRGPRLWPAIFLGRFLAALAVSSPQPWWADVGIAAATTLGSLLPVLAIRRLGPFDPRLGSLTDMSRLIALGAVAGGLLSGALALIFLWASGTPSDRLPQILETWTFGFAVGVMVVGSAILSWWRPQDRPRGALRWLHLALALLATTGLAAVVFLSPRFTPIRTWHLFPILVWSALAFSVPGASLALMITSMLAIWGGLHGWGPISEIATSPAARLLVAQQFAAASSVTILVLAAVADERRGRDRLARSEADLRAESEALETLNQTGAMIAAELDQETLVQKVTDAGVALTGAQFGAFFYNVLRDDGGAYTLYTLSGAPRSAFESFGMPRDTEVFHPTFAGTHIIRSDDITADPRYGKMAPHFGMPTGHLPVRSYLAAPVKSRSGEVLGGLFFGHSDVGVFADRAERVVAGIASQAAIAIDNARLYQDAQQEIARRARAEQHQRLLINELNHRVKNTLATVQSIAHQTARAGQSPEHSYEAFMERLIALSRAHDVLTKQRWEGANLAEVLRGATQPFGDGRFKMSGPSVWLEPSTTLALAMALHELATNASKYGALSGETGVVSVDWSVAEDRLTLTWRETGGPRVQAPKHKGFGSRLLERGLPADLGGTVGLEFRPTGVVCVITARLTTPHAEDRAAAEA